MKLMSNIILYIGIAIAFVDAAIMCSIETDTSVFNTFIIYGTLLVCLGIGVGIAYFRNHIVAFIFGTIDFFKYHDMREYGPHRYHGYTNSRMDQWIACIYEAYDEVKWSEN